MNFMPSGTSSEVKFEIGHVLFIDIVGYSKLLINEQSEQLQTLRQIVRGTEQFRTAEAEGKLLRLPTGDGGALVFRTTAEAAVLCALEISKELKHHPELRVRMGIHSGPGNPEVPERFKTIGTAAAKARAKSAIPKWASIGAAILILIVIAFGSFLFWQREKPKTSSTPSVIPEKSIAVLPFVNMSADKGDEYLSDGVSEELIAALSKITGLQVKARTSSFAFKGKNEDIQKIGDRKSVV